jgi:hypothetical protein
LRGWGKLLAITLPLLSPTSKGTTNMALPNKKVKGNISIGFSDIPSLKKLIQESQDNDQDTFDYKGGTLYVPYAKYLIEYLTNIQKEYQ